MGVESEKTRKYQRLVDSLKIYTKKEVFFIPFILDLNNYNFCSEKEKINFILPGDVDESFFTESTHVLAENIYQQCLETIALIYVILRRRYDYTVEEIKDFLSCLNFKTKGEGKELENTSWRRY